MKREIELDDALPAAGEPLQPRIDETNQVLLEEELKERQDRAQARLTRAQKSRLEQRYKQLWHKLRKAHWNDLIKERWDKRQQYERLKYEYVNADSDRQPKIKVQARPVYDALVYLNECIAKLQPLADEFDQITNKLEAHRQVLKFEREEEENKKAFVREFRVWKDQIESVFRQSKRLHHAGYDSKGNWFCDIPQIERGVFREDRVLYLIKVSRKTLFGKWKSALPYNVDISALTCDDTLMNLQAATNRVVTVVRSQSGQRLFYCIHRLDSPDGIPRRVLHSKVMAWYPSEDHAKTPWCAGVTSDRKTYWFNFEDANHILMAGSTKSGKSNQINQMIATLATMNSPSEVRFILIDNKGGIEFTHWKDLKHLARPMIKTVGEVLPALRWARKIMERRLRMFESIGAKNLPSYRAKVADKSRLPRLIIVIDEMATLLDLGELTDKIKSELRVLVAQGRAVGVHVIICTQSVNVEIVDQPTKTNMQLRIAGFMPSHYASQAITDSVIAARLPADVVGRMAFVLGRLEIIAQTPYMPDEGIALTVDISHQFADPDDTEFNSIPFDGSEETEGEESIPLMLMPAVRFGREDVIKLALERFEGKLTPIHMHSVLGNEVISLRALRALVDQIISSKQIIYQGDEYGLKKVGRNYVLVKLERPLNAVNEISDAEIADTSSSDERSDEYSTEEGSYEPAAD